MAATNPTFEVIGITVNTPFGPLLGLASDINPNGVAYYKYTSGVNTSEAIPTLCVGIGPGPIASSAFGVPVATGLAIWAVVTYYAQLQQIGLSHRETLSVQQSNWAAMGLTDWDAVYMSKHNLSVPNDLPPSHFVIRSPMSNATALTHDLVPKNEIAHFTYATLMGIHTTELFRIVFNIGTTDILAISWLSVFRQGMNSIVEYAKIYPSAVRFELVFKGTNVTEATLSTLIHGTTTDEPVPCPHWRVETNPQWQTRLVHCDLTPGAPNATFAHMDSRFAVRVQL